MGINTTKKMKKIQKTICLMMMLMALTTGGAMAQTPTKVAPAAEMVDSALSTAGDSMLLDDELLELSDTAAVDELAEGGAYTQLKTKFVEGGAGFMSLVALALILGLACCIERIVYLTMSEIDAKKFMVNLEKRLTTEGVESAKDLCRNTRGPVASICYQGLLRINDTAEEIERSVAAYASVQVGNMEKGCSWITLFIAMAPSLGFLGTVIGMVMAFDQIQMAGDISPTIVAAGMKVALITTIFGIITALILQLFYNYILSKIEHLTAQMEESGITLLDIIKKVKGQDRAAGLK
jgi:biopolymer transport protein ExbB